MLVINFLSVYILIPVLIILIILDILGIRKKSLTNQNYIGIGIILFIIVWPQIQKGEIFGFSFEKRIKEVESEVIELQERVEDIFDKYETEIFEFDDLDSGKIRHYEKDNSYYLDIPLKYRPIYNSIDLWFFAGSVPPTYSINDENILTLRLGSSWTRDMFEVEYYRENIEYLIVIKYVKE